MSGRVAVCNWNGLTFRAKHVETCDGKHVMRALERGPRFMPGSKIIVLENEVVSWEPVEENPAPLPFESAPAASAAGALQDVHDIAVAQFRRHPPRKASPMATPLNSKIKALTDRSRSFNKRCEADMDALLAGYDAADKKREAAAEVHRTHLADVHADIDETVKALTELTNAPFGDSSEG